MMLIAFQTSHTLSTKGPSRAEKNILYFILKIYFPNPPIWIKVLCNGCITCQLSKPYPNQKQIAEKQDIKGQNYIQSQNLFRYKRTNITILRKKINIQW